MFQNISRFYVACAVFVFLAFLGTEALASENGNHAKDWTKGQTIHVFVDPIPKGAPAGTTEAVAEAIKGWNDAQAPFGGLKLVTGGADKNNSEIHIVWRKNLGDWGQTISVKQHDRGFEKETVTVGIKYGHGLEAKAITRILMHELGHAEGLGHSAESSLMKKDAYSSNPGHAASVKDLNSADPVTQPTADDKAGKKALWGTVAKRSKSDATSGSLFDGLLWNYSYTLQGLLEAGLTDPVTEFTLDLPARVGESDFTVTVLPTGWGWDFYSGLVASAGTGFDDGERSSPSLLSFFALGPGFGIAPGDELDFGISSLLAPASSRAFTNSPSFDSDEFVVLAPSVVSEPSTLVLFLAGVLGILLVAPKTPRPRVTMRRACGLLINT
ncbi:MAG: hypothetical protein ABI300_04230 [Rhodanobacter sp.]